VRNIILLPENYNTWEMYCIVSGQVNESGQLKYESFPFVFDLFLTDYCNEEKKRIFNLICKIHQVRLSKGK